MPGEEGSARDSEEDEQEKEMVSLETWIRKSDVIYSCKCTEYKGNGRGYPRYNLAYRPCRASSFLNKQVIQEHKGDMFLFYRF